MFYNQFLLDVHNQTVEALLNLPEWTPPPVSDLAYKLLTSERSQDKQPGDEVFLRSPVTFCHFQDPMSLFWLFSICISTESSSHTLKTLRMVTKQP